MFPKSLAYLSKEHLPTILHGKKYMFVNTSLQIIILVLYSHFHCYVQNVISIDYTFYNLTFVYFV